ncbi:NlpC/P60 family protein [Nocardia asteroides]|uniref:NlpC/P60 family protein n=1 Tax=Nocardia asteroides TaxID=1824 RepID=UPI00031FB7F9|nr:NlpC/P60 family protein [Nocardia asteroides]TLF64231.1 NlpC/P60 family protein [Nocardia asteroides NBRC 15531]UGT50665.1 NlpC/P60 family protein [Nocardia asteroides]SFN31411.1 Cell wall-associated hydrolase, NlpC family [Nocardia asteroides]VEG36509.1 Peptidoglycan endopeptidase RipA precursor [Nocardia asteroides]
MRAAGRQDEPGLLRVAAGLLLALALLASAGPVAAVPPPPPNPSDGEIAGAGAQVDARVGEIGVLINRVAAADQQLRALDDVLAAKREAVNQALVDLQSARDAADAAAAAVADSQNLLADAGAKVAGARQEFDQLATQAYVRPVNSSVVTYLASATPDTAMDRAQVLSMVSKNQRQVLDDLRRTQIAQANQNAAARQAKTDADAAAGAAEQKKNAAQTAMSVAKNEFDAQSVARDNLQRDRAAAQAALDVARATVSGLQSQREVFLAWDDQRKAEVTALLAAANAAAQRAAADQAARDRAARLGEGQRPHTELESTPASPRKTKPRPTRPQVTGSAAIETVIDRAMSQLGVTYAWGGGDEDGPTLGIRDGGTADAHGDYNKIGFDCSGLMLYAFAGIGVSLPHYSGYQYNAGTRVDVDDRERGDMLFWGPGGSAHVALYLGDGTMIEAPESGDVVKISPVREDGIMPYAVRIVTE